MMTDPAALSLFQLGQSLGPVGLLMVFWFLDSRRTDKILKSYKEDAQEARQMYKDNVILVKQYADLARDLKDIVIMNTQGFQIVHDEVQGARKDIRDNDFCPMVTVKKEMTVKGDRG